MRVLREVGNFTVDVEIPVVPLGKLGPIAKGLVYGLCREIDAVRFELSPHPDGNIAPAVRIDLPSPLTDERINSALEAARLAKNTADLLVQKFLVSHDGDLDFVVCSMIKDKRWQAAAEMLALASHLEKSVSQEQATTITECLLDALDARSDLLHARHFKSAVGGDLALEIGGIALKADPSVLERSAGLAQFARMAEYRAQNSS